MKEKVQGHWTTADNAEEELALLQAAHLQSICSFCSLLSAKLGR